MKKEQIELLINKKIIKKQYENEYRLIRPLDIIITKKVIDSLKSIYVENYENGGILEAIPVSESVLKINQFIKIDNTAKVGYSYNPSTVLFQKAIDLVIQKGNLPFAIHTHPLRLGIDSYDSKNEKFYLRPSKSDKQISRTGITEYFNFPEVIFTVDKRFKNGFDFSFFTGFIFPASNIALSTLQLVSLGLGFLFRKNKPLLIGSGSVFLFDFIRRPKYQLLSNGDYLISLKN